MGLSDYPNPLSHNFKLESSSSSDAALNIEIYNLSGVLAEKHANVIYDEYTEYRQNLSNGMYLVSVTQNGKTEFIRVVKAN